MIKLTTDDIKKVADLIKIAIPEKDLDNFRGQLETSLDPAKDFEELDTSNVKITSQTVGTKNVYRKDEIKPSLSQEDALLNAHSKSSGYIEVKKVLTDEN